MEINENTTISIPLRNIRNLVSIIVVSAFLLLTYITLFSKVQEHELEIAVIKDKITRVPDKEIENLYKKIEKLEKQLLER